MNKFWIKFWAFIFFLINVVFIADFIGFSLPNFIWTHIFESSSYYVFENNIFSLDEVIEFIANLLVK